ncbi:hypothetical protein ACIQUM_33980 [Amycolatopsis azurea]|uniref:hypothetical protein n=1 Tax=Amycolatopsis azurea TaxID=36819 RepID=UPI003809020C
MHAISPRASNGNFGTLSKSVMNNGSPRPPLAWRLLGLALALLLLSLAVYVLMHAVQIATAIVAALLPLIAMVGIYKFMVGKVRKK